MSATRRLYVPTVSRAMRGAAGRLSWGLGDQAVSSLTNFAVGVVVARTLGLTEFGIFTLAWVTYGVALNVYRGLATDPLVVRFSGVPVETWRAAVARSSGSALLLGLGSGAVCVLAGIALGGDVGAAFIALGVVLPGLLLQDAFRFAFFAAGQGRKAFVNDIIWAVGLAPALMFATGRGSVFAFLLGWGVAGAVAAACGCIQAGLVPSMTGTRGWVRQHRDLSLRYMLENISHSGAAQLRMFGLGAIAGLADVGTLHGAQLLLAPILMVLRGFGLVGVSEAARVLRRTPRRLPYFCVLVGGGQAAAALAWGCALLLCVSDSFGQQILGSVWESSSDLILPVTIAVAAAGFTAGAFVGLRALGAARRSLFARLFTSAMLLAGGLAGATVAGALGTSWGSALGVWLGAAVWWVQLRAALRELAIATPTKGSYNTHTRATMDESAS